MATRIIATGHAAEDWRVVKDGAHVANIRLEINANGRGTYYRFSPDRPDLGQWSTIIGDGSFTFDVWDRATVTGILRALVGDEGADIAVKLPSR